MRFHTLRKWFTPLIAGGTLLGQGCIGGEEIRDVLVGAGNDLIEGAVLSIFSIFTDAISSGITDALSNSVT
jgi:hypothetical protein